MDLSLDLSLDAFAGWGGVAPASFDAAPSAYTTPFPMVFEGQSPAFDIDWANGRAYIGGTTYTNAEGTAAGIYSAAREEWTITGAGTWPAASESIEVYCDFTTSATPTPAGTEWAFTVHDDTANNRIAILRTNTNVLQIQNRRSNTPQNALLSGLVASTRYRAAGKCKLNDMMLSRDGANGHNNTTANTSLAATCTKIRRGAMHDGTGTGITCHRSTIWYNKGFRLTQYQAMSLTPTPYENNVGTIFGGMNEPAAATLGNKTLIPLYSGGVSMATIYHDGISQPHITDFKRQTYGSSNTTDHATPCVLKHSSGVFITAHAGHQINAGVYISRGTGADAGNQVYLGSAILVTSGSSGGADSEYTQLYERSTDGRVYLITKGDSYGWGYFTSDDAGATWSAFKWIVRDLTLAIKNYIKGDWLADGVTIRFLGFPNSALGGGSDIRVMDFNTSIGKIYSGGAGPDYAETELHDITNVDPTAAANWTQLTSIKSETDIAWTVHNPRWIWGGLAHRQDLNNDTKDHYFVKLTGANPWNPAHWTFTHIAWGGNEIGSARAGALAHFSGETGLATAKVYAAYYDETNARSVCEVYDADDADGTAWTKTAEVWRYSGTDLTGVAMRPHCPQGASANFPVVGNHCTMFDDYNSFTNSRLIWPGNY